MRQVLFAILSIYLMFGYSQRLKKFNVVESSFHQSALALVSSSETKSVPKARLRFSGGDEKALASPVNLDVLAHYQPMRYTGFGLRHIPNEYQDVFLVYHLPAVEAKSKMAVRFSVSNFDMLFISYNRLFEL